jgi:sigma-B regulation protein RsbU (phosphoserine phosphatase)
MRPRAPLAVYFLLFAYIAISLAYLASGSVSLIIGYFDLRQQVQQPFEVDVYNDTVTSVRPEAQRAGIQQGDKLVSLNGTPYTGRSQLQSARWYAKPGEALRAGIRKADGSNLIASIPLVGEPYGVRLGDAAFVIVIQILIPLFCLVLGYWVALARPADLNAWFILILLSFPEAFISTSTYNWWPGGWLALRLNWHVALIVLAPAALLWLGFLFPERSRIDVRLPWLKWLILAIQFIGLTVALVTDYASWYDHGMLPARQEIDAINDRVVTSMMLVVVETMGGHDLNHLRQIESIAPGVADAAAGR